MSIGKIKESDLCKPLAAFMEKSYKGCELYYEVKTIRDRKVDCVCKTADGETIAIEMKLHANLTVLYQAFNNLECCNYSMILIPAGCLRDFSRSFIKTLCLKLGIGLLLINRYNEIKQETCAVKNDNPSNAGYVKLFEQQKNFVGGEASSACWSEYSQTIYEITNWLKEHKSGNLTDILKQINHHYSSVSNGKQAIMRYIKRGILKQFEIEDLSGVIRLKEE